MDICEVVEESRRSLAPYRCEELYRMPLPAILNSMRPYGTLVDNILEALDRLHTGDWEPSVRTLGRSRRTLGRAWMNFFMRIKSLEQGFLAGLVRKLAKNLSKPSCILPTNSPPEFGACRVRIWVGIVAPAWANRPSRVTQIAGAEPR